MWNPPAKPWHSFPVNSGQAAMLQSVETIKYKNISPSKKLRSLRRLFSFQKKKSSPYPNPKIRNLVKETVSNVNVMPWKKSLCLSLSQPTLCSIQPSPPKPLHHPNIIEACRLLYGKHPDKLSSEEREHFSGYRQYKINNGEPIEEDFVYNPSDTI